MIDEQPDSSQTRFWTNRWSAGKTPWDLGGVPENLVSFLSRERTPAKVLIPGCGSGYEVKAFHEAGHDVTAIEFSEPAVVHAREVLGPLGHKVIHGNFFKHDFADHRYELIYERGFLCSLPTARWPEFASRMAQLIAPGGRLIGLFLYGNEPEPPPYPLTEQTAEQLFGTCFRLLSTAKSVGDSVPVYQGLERWQEWQRLTA
jgi:hypothetical protein